MWFRLLLLMIPVTLFNLAYGEDFCSTIPAGPEHYEYEQALRTCKEIRDSGKFKDAKVYIISANEDLAKIVNLKQKPESKGSIFILMGQHYQLSEALDLKNDTAFVGGLNLTSRIAHFIPPIDEPATLVRFNKTGGSLLFHHVDLSDELFEQSPPLNEWKKLALSDDSPIHQKAIDIVAAENVTFYNASINGRHHKMLLYLGCNKEGLVTNVTTTHASFEMASVNSKGIIFHCSQEKHKFNNQIEFSEFIVNEETMHYGTYPTTSPSNTTAAPKFVKKADRAIVIDTMGKMEFTHSVCNSVQYGGTMDHRPTADPKYYIEIAPRSKKFDGIIAFKTLTKEGYYFAPYADEFSTNEFCPYDVRGMTIDYKNYLPDPEYVAHRQKGTPLSEGQKQGYVDIGAYESLKSTLGSWQTAAGFFMAATAFALVHNVYTVRTGRGGFLWKLMRKIPGGSSQLDEPFSKDPATTS